MTVGWIDASAGASGDMLLGALVGSGVPLEVMGRAIDAVVPEAVKLTTSTVDRGHLAAVRCLVETVERRPPVRRLAEIRRLLADAGLDPDVSAMATRVFASLADVEAAAHGVSVDDVHFHEVGALDSIADVVGACAGLHHLGVREWTVSPVAVGGGRVATAHGSLPVPVPAVVGLLRGVPTYAGPGRGELCTPTGAALLAACAASYGDQPPMVVRHVGAGAGTRDFPTHANVLRLLVGDPVPAPTHPPAYVIEANVDDLDPRVWPHVLSALLAAGADDAWLTPILMKKGRPAHTLHVLARPDRIDDLRAIVISETTTIGFREHAVVKHPLDRTVRRVELHGALIDVKVASYAGREVNVQPEHDQVANLAERTGLPLVRLLDEARMLGWATSADAPAPGR